MAQWILNVTKGSLEATAMIILWASGVISGIIDNIPYTATMTPMLLEIQKTMGADYTYPLWWCLSLGACLGGNMTIIGAAANVIVSEASAHNGYPIPFMKFLKYGVVTMLISLVISSAPTSGKQSRAVFPQAACSLSRRESSSKEKLRSKNSFLRNSGRSKPFSPQANPRSSERNFTAMRTVSSS